MDLTRAIDVLGLGAELRSEVDLVRMMEHGFPAATVSELQRLGAISNIEMVQIIPRRTLTQAARRGRLSTEISNRVARAVGIFALAHDTSGSDVKANGWMRRPNSALEGATPLSLLHT